MRGIVSIGSNCGDRSQHISEALTFIEGIAEVGQASGIFESPDFRGSGKKYLNAIIIIEAPQEYFELNGVFKRYEETCGRNPEARKRGEVPIDIDIVVWGEEIKKPVDYKSEYFKRGLAMLNEKLANNQE